MHPFSFAGETKHFESGEGITLFEWQGFKVAPLVCYDLRFPELFRHAVSRGAELFVVIANWPQVREEHWLALLRARAIENQAFVFGVNRSGADPHAGYGGRSLALNPRGETIAEGSRQAEALVCNISKEELLAYRQAFPALADMRRDLLGGSG
jgi:predicted amidohydrolase